MGVLCLAKPPAPSADQVGGAFGCHHSLARTGPQAPAPFTSQKSGRIGFTTAVRCIWLTLHRRSKGSSKPRASVELDQSIEVPPACFGARSQPCETVLLLGADHDSMLARYDETVDQFGGFGPVFITPKGRSQPSTPKLRNSLEEAAASLPELGVGGEEPKSNKNSTIGFSGSSIQATFRRAVLDGHSGGKFTPEKRLQNERQWFRCPLVQGVLCKQIPSS